MTDVASEAPKAAPAPVAAKPAPVEVTQAPTPAPIYRGKFLVTDISKSSNGTVTAKLAAAYDHSIDQDKTLVVGPNPKGTIEIEINAKLGDRLVHGSVFYLVSA